MDAWSHMLFTFAIVVGLGYYPLEKSKTLLLIFVIMEIIHFWIAFTTQNPIYNFIGTWSRPFIMGYLMYTRVLATDPVEKAQIERITIILFATTYSSGSSHAFDEMIYNAGYLIVWKDWWRGHNFWHTPLAGIVFSFVATIMIYQTMKTIGSNWENEFEPRSSFKALYLACFFGYFLHIVADVITYDFQIFWFFPFHEYSFCGEDLVNQGVFSQDATPHKPEGTVYYWSIPFFALIVVVITSFRYILNPNDVAKKFQHIKN